MAESVIQSGKRCWFCGTERELERHHIFFGTANRKVSERHGYVVWLCRAHHTGPDGVHNYRRLDIQIKRVAQAHYEETHSREEFIKEFGRSYL